MDERGAPRFSAREFVVELLGSFVPGVVFLVIVLTILAWPIFLISEGDTKDILEASKSLGFLGTFFILLLGHVIGTIASRRRVRSMDRLSWEYDFLPIATRKLRTETQRRGRIMFRKSGLARLFARINAKKIRKSCPAKLSKARERLLWLSTWPSSGVSYTSFPYRNLRASLELNGLKHLSQLVPWDAKEKNPSKCNEHFINALKMRVLVHNPPLHVELTRMEAHLRLIATTLYLLRWLKTILLVVGFPAFLVVIIWTIIFVQELGNVSALLTVLSDWKKLEPVCVYVAYLIAWWFGIQQIRRTLLGALHGQRIREVYAVLEAIYTTFRHHKEMVLDLCPDFDPEYPEVCKNYLPRGTSPGL